MNSEHSEPQPFGELVPPGRIPPTAVGTATPPPPRRPKLPRFRKLTPFRSLYVYGASMVGGGVLLRLFGPQFPIPELVEVAASFGLFLLVFGPLFLLFLLAVHFDVVSRLQNWRRTLLIRRRVKLVGQPPRPSA